MSSTPRLQLAPLVVLITLSLAARPVLSQPVLYPSDYLGAKIAGKRYPAGELERFASLARLWGALNYFHPRVNSGSVVTDSLALRSIRILLNDPSAAGFRAAVDTMLALLGDPATRRQDRVEQNRSLLFTHGSRIPVVREVPGQILYIAFPTIAASNLQDPSSIKGLMPSDWDNASGIVFDLRNEEAPSEYGEYDFLYDVMPKITEVVAGNVTLPAIYERSAFYNGFVSQTSSMPNIYNNGWRTVALPGQTSSGTAKPLNKPVAFVYNQFTHPELIRQLAVLRAAGLCRLIYEGALNNDAAGRVIPFVLADSLTVRIRVSDYLSAGNQSLAEPDLVFPAILDTTLDGDYMNRVRSLMQNKSELLKKPGTAGMDFPGGRPARYGDTLVPPADKRLFGLYNFWNAIHYFSPYLHYQDHSWDSMLYKHIPIFLAADDSASYNLAVRSLAASTQDSHGFLGSTFSTPPWRKWYGAWPAFQTRFINHRLYIVDIGPDSNTALKQLRLWDEITHVDGLALKEWREKWRNYFASSNESTFERDLAGFAGAGPLNSTASFRLLRDGKPLSVELKRDGRYMGTATKVDFNGLHKPVEMLSGNIGYINMGSLTQSLIDSAMTALANTKAIIFDIRNYPRGTAWGIAPRLTDSSRKAVAFDKPFVTYDYLQGTEEKSTLRSFFTVIPSGKKRYTGKVIILCNQQTQSQAEYTIMMFQGATACTVIGSQTAGADGNITDVALPGGYSITFSGLGIYYADGGGTQRSGIRIDIHAEPTLAGLKAGRDELLERAIRFANTGK